MHIKLIIHLGYFKYVYAIPSPILRFNLLFRYTNMLIDITRVAFFQWQCPS